MKILFTGGGTGGHFYPLIAVAQAIREQAKVKKVLPPQFYFMAPHKYNPRALFDNEIDFVYVPAGKVRRYFSILNITDAFKTVSGCFIALIKMFSIYPDVIFSKGGYTSFPPLLAARLLRIPVVMHESDSHPGRANLWTSKFAKRIALSYPSAAKFFNIKDAEQKIAYTGNPIRPEIAQPLKTGAFEFLNLEQNIPVILILGGSQGSQTINDVIVQTLPELLNKYQIIHQTGRANLKEIQSTTAMTLKDHPYVYRYHPFDYLNELALRMSAGAATIIVSRAGSTIFEIAAWGVPSIIIPLPSSISHDQTANAFAYAEAGASSVIEENNLTPNILVEEINRIVGSSAISKTMSERAKAFSRLDSASLIAQTILNIALEHEK